MPDYLVESAWLEHAPFAFWLVEAHRPRVVVELGTHRGFSYCCFCQAIERLGLDAKAFAIDCWQGDEHAGFYGREVFEELSAYHQRYSAFSRLVRSSFDDAVSLFEDGSIDLLHIDGRHFYDDVKHDFETWLPKLSTQGMVLFHDTNVRERNFGVKRFWSELVEIYPRFEFIHEHGLGILGVGLNLSSEVSDLLAASDDKGVVRTVRDAYEHLGGHIKLRRSSGSAPSLAVPRRRALWRHWWNVRKSRPV